MEEQYDALLAVRPFSTELVDEFLGGSLDHDQFDYVVASTETKEDELDINPFDRMISPGNFINKNYIEMSKKGKVLIAGAGEHREEIEGHSDKFKRFTDQYDVIKVNIPDLGPDVHEENIYSPPDIF
jgi:hypothetical protein